jgi:hypothetical protein
MSDYEQNFILKICSLPVKIFSSFLQPWQQAQQQSIQPWPDLPPQLYKMLLVHSQQHWLST